jgi:outer membrane protein
MLNYIMRLFVLISVLIVPWSIALAQETTTAQPAQSLRIAVINMKVVRQQSTAMQAIREQINALRASFQAEVQMEEESLRAANQELARQRSILGAEAFAAERREFETRLADVQRNVQKRRQDLEQARDKAAAEVQVVLNKIIAGIASERSLGLILPREQIVFVIRQLEITAEVVERLNAAMPSVTVSQPGQ